MLEATQIIRPSLIRIPPEDNISLTEQSLSAVCLKADNAPYDLLHRRTTLFFVV